MLLENLLILPHSLTDLNGRKVEHQKSPVTWTELVTILVVMVLILSTIKVVVNWMLWRTKNIYQPKLIRIGKISHQGTTYNWVPKRNWLGLFVLCRLIRSGT